MREVIEEPPRPPSDVDESIPAEIDEVILTALAKEKSDRYESVLYLRDELKHLYDSVEDY